MKDILLRIVGNQGIGSDDDGDKIEFVTEGRFSQEDDRIRLSYEETELSGMEGCTTHMEISGQKVRMSRSGAPVPVDTIMEFEKGKRYNGLYETPYGAVDMEILTNDVWNGLVVKPVGGEEDAADVTLVGTLCIDYHISLKGLGEVHNRLDVEILPQA